MNSCFDMSVFLVLAVIDNAEKAAFSVGMSGIVSACHHLWGCACTSTFVEQLIGTLLYQLTHDWPESTITGRFG